MGTRKQIIALAARGKPIRSSQLVRRLGISRQTIAAHLKVLVEKGLLSKTGSTRGATYQIATGRKAPRRSETVRVHLFKKVAGLEEDRLFSEVDRKLSLKGALPANVYSIASYAFTEMVNNCIDHSSSKIVSVTVTLNRNEFRFEVRDWGIGAFSNVMSVFKLEDEFAALEAIFKGKHTTLPERHSGEGIFFTSRIADLFILRSHRLQATIDNRNQDTFVREARSLKGTHVIFEIAPRTRRTLRQLFEEHTTEEHVFDKGVLRVSLSQMEGLLSRSQARRLASGLEKYKEVTFDFTGVSEIGQAFADELFRVLPLQHPSIRVSYKNAKPAVEFMISRAKRAR